MKITVIGTGYVGLIAGLGFAKWGDEVVCLDVIPEKIEKLQKGICPIYEPGAEVQLSDGLSSGRLRFTCDVKSAVEHGELIFIAVGTPEAADGSADLCYVYSAADEIADYMQSYKLVVDKSTVPVGTARALRQRIADSAARIQKTAAAVAECDALCSFAAVAVHNNFCRPEVDESGVIEIREGRHPVVEKVLRDSLFVPNDTFMGEKEERVAIITGPNMAGKSTYMRQVALIVLMAQMGSFVPAKYAHIGVVDRIFTRIGASDDLSAGQSTFMVEMTEVSDILHQATKNSLLILDEIGRGTSTFDGMAIARAVLEYCADKKTLGAKTLFATHYHELTEMENTLPGTVNYNIAVKRRGEDIIFLRKIVPGGADRSYGIEVAKLAGLPEKVVQRAKVILKELEDENGVQYVAAWKETDQVSLDAMSEGEVLDAIRRCQPDTLTPIEAMSLLYELKQKLSR